MTKVIDHERERLGNALGHPGVHEVRREVAGQAGRAERGSKKAGQRDADLDRSKEPVGVLVQLGDPAAPVAPLGDAADLALAQGHQGDLGGREERPDRDEEEDECQDAQRPAHGAPPGVGRYAGLEQPSMRKG